MHTRRVGRELGTVFSTTNLAALYPVVSLVGGYQGQVAPWDEEEQEEEDEEEEKEFIPPMAEDSPQVRQDDFIYPTSRCFLYKKISYN